MYLWGSMVFHKYETNHAMFLQTLAVGDPHYGSTDTFSTVFSYLTYFLIKLRFSRKKLALFYKAQKQAAFGGKNDVFPVCFPTE